MQCINARCSTHSNYRITETNFLVLGWKICSISDTNSSQFKNYKYPYKIPSKDRSLSSVERKINNLDQKLRQFQNDQTYPSRKCLPRDQSSSSMKNLRSTFTAHCMTHVLIVVMNLSIHHHTAGDISTIAGSLCDTREIHCLIQVRLNASFLHYFGKKG